MAIFIMKIKPILCIMQAKVELNGKSYLFINKTVVVL